MVAELFIIYIFIFLFGTAFGSFFNVCISRIPLKESLLAPSHCPKCNKKITPYNNIPLISYLVLRGRCKDCGEPIAISYFWVELITPILFLLLFWKFNSRFTIEYFKYLIFVCFGIIIFFVDLKHKIIPDLLSLPLILLGLIFGFLAGSWNGLLYSVIGATSGFSLFLIISLAYSKFRKIEVLGGGDIKLIAAIGAFVGWIGVLSVTVIASAIALFILILIRHDHREQFPFGPFLISGIILHVIAGDYLINLYLSLIYGMLY